MVMNALAEWAWSPWHMLFPLLWLGILVTVLFLFRGRRGHWQIHAAEEVLAERYARGEISVEEYRQRLDVLRRKGN